MQRIPTLVGVSGHFIGEVFPLEYGKPLTVGRSRTADFSLRRTLRYKSQDQAARDKAQSNLDALRQKATETLTKFGVPVGTELEYAL